MTVSETAWPITLTPCASTVTVVSAGTVTVVVVEVEVSVAVLVVVEVVPTVEVWVAMLSQDEQKALAEVYERSFVTQGATDTAAQGALWPKGAPRQSCWIVRRMNETGSVGDAKSRIILLSSLVCIHNEL